MTSTEAAASAEFNQRDGSTNVPGSAYRSAPGPPVSPTATARRAGTRTRSRCPPTCPAAASTGSSKATRYGSAAASPWRSACSTGTGDHTNRSAVARLTTGRTNSGTPCPMSRRADSPISTGRGRPAVSGSPPSDRAAAASPASPDRSSSRTGTSEARPGSAIRSGSQAAPSLQAAARVPWKPRPSRSADHGPGRCHARIPRAATRRADCSGIPASRRPSGAAAGGSAPVSAASARSRATRGPDRPACRPTRPGGRR